jgi:hypothetical protein
MNNIGEIGLAALSKVLGVGDEDQNTRIRVLEEKVLGLERRVEFLEMDAVAKRSHKKKGG